MDAVFLSSIVAKNLLNLMRPLGPYQIAWYLRKHNYSVQILEFVYQLSDEQIIELLDKFVTKNTKIIGLGLMINMDGAAAGSVIKKLERVLAICKKRYPQAKLIVGGPSAAAWSRMWRNSTLFDYVFTGHTEDQVLGLMNHLVRGEPHPQFELVDGNKLLREATPVRHEKLFNIEEDDHLWHESDCVQPGESLPLELGRGCIFKCKFCRYPYIGKHKNDFSRKMECVRQELVDNYERWGVTNYYMLDDTFNADQDRLRAFYTMTQTLPFKIQYATYIRIDLLHAHPDSQYMLPESGLKGCFFGIESFNKEAAELVGKAWSVKAKEWIPTLHNDIWKKSVNFQLGFIAGLPPETLPTLRETNQWCMDNDIPSWTWAGLTINRDAHDQYKSDFDINAEQFGFEWINYEGKPMWKSQYATAKIAKEWEFALVEEAKPYQKLACWYLFELPNFGYKLDEFMSKRQIEIPWREVASRRKLWFANYLKSLKNLPRP
jgi:radical SAM superfamily enzyme YgiQ (UPF0313 family)